MSTLTCVAMIFIVSSVVHYVAGASQIFDVVNYGAQPDGETDSTKAFQAAWKAACGSSTPATLQVPAGKFLVGKLEFRGPCNNQMMLVSISGTLVAPSVHNATGYCWILFKMVDGLQISGGILDGQGSSLWDCKASSQNCPVGFWNLGLSSTKNVEISGLTSINSQLFHIEVSGSSNVNISSVNVSAPAHSPNTDGIHLQLSTGVTITNSSIGTGDDCVSVGLGVTNLWIENVSCGPGHGISIGSLGKAANENGVQKVTVKLVNFTNTANGVRIKSWGKTSSSFVKDVLFQHILMTNVNNSIVIDQDYCPHLQKHCTRQESTVKISNVMYQDITGTSARRVAVKIDCSEISPCSNIKLDHVSLTYKNQPALVYCQNADICGSVGSPVPSPAPSLVPSPVPSPAYSSYLY